MTAGALIDILAAVHAIPSTAAAVNFYRDDSDREGDFHSTAEERRDRLRTHLHRVSAGDLVLVGEAPGWKGARQSGVPFTSAKTVGLRGSSESSATIMHGMLTSLGVADRALLWNAFPLHPHEVGSPRSNRTPTAVELELGIDALRLAVAGRRVVCVGNKARQSVEQILGVEVPSVAGVSMTSPAIAIRHPANGGAPMFRSGLIAAVKAWRLA